MQTDRDRMELLIAEAHCFASLLATSACGGLAEDAERDAILAIKARDSLDELRRVFHGLGK